MTDLQRRKEESIIIDALLKAGKWEEARKQLFEWQNKSPKSHWIFTRLSSTYADEGKYNEALDYVKKALKIVPNCPLALWDYAGILYMLDRDDDSIPVYKRLIRRGATRIDKGKCGQGIRWARSLVNDCRYTLGLIYAAKGEYCLAGDYIKTYLINRNRNCPSIYNLREVKKDYTLIVEGKDPRSQ